MRKAVSIFILAAFITTSVQLPTYASTFATEETGNIAQAIDPMPRLPVPGVMVHLSPEFTPAYLKGIIIHPENALKFDFIIYRGDKELSGDEKNREYTKLIKYFLASLAVPDEDQWVNLSPYEKDRIIKDDFGKTEMGRDLLAQDYLLKQITASLIYPESNLGKKFWDRVYAQAQEQFGTTSIPVNTFNKVWITPDSALIYERGNMAYVINQHLKVMLEEDYLSLRKHSGIQSAPGPANETHSIASKIVKEIVLPELEREVNEDKNFAALRQVYSGMLLAAWYKRALRESLLGKIYANKDKVKGVDQNPRNNEIIYQQYLRAYKKGVFNFIKEDVDKYTNEMIPRKYFSGGAESWGEFYSRAMITHDAAMVEPDIVKNVSDLDIATSVALEAAATKPKVPISPRVQALFERDLARAGINPVRPKGTTTPVSAAMTAAQEQIASLLDNARQQRRVPNVLFLCTGNINRSAVMEMVLKDRARRDGIKVNVSSAGILKWDPVQRELVGHLKQVFGNLERTQLEKLLKAIARGDWSIFQTGGPLSEAHRLTDQELVLAFKNFDEDKIFSEIRSIGRKRGPDFINNYNKLTKQLSILFDRVENEIAQKRVFGESHEIISAARENGISGQVISEYRPKILTPSFIRRADVIIVAEESHIDFINRNFPQARNKTFLLKALSQNFNQSDPDLPDPSLGEISENNLFQQIKELIDKDLIPLFNTANSIQPVPEKEANPSLVKEIRLTWDNGKVSMRVRQAPPNFPGALIVHTIIWGGHQVPLLMDDNLLDGLLVLAGGELQFGTEERSNEDVIIFGKRVFYFSPVIFQGGLTMLFHSSSSENQGRFLITQKLSNLGNGSLSVQTLTHASDTVIDDGVNSPKVIREDENSTFKFNNAMTASRAMTIKQFQKQILSSCKTLTEEELRKFENYLRTLIDDPAIYDLPVGQTKQRFNLDEEAISVVQILEDFLTPRLPVLKSYEDRAEGIVATAKIVRMALAWKVVKDRKSSMGRTIIAQWPINNNRVSIRIEQITEGNSFILRFGGRVINLPEGEDFFAKDAQEIVSVLSEFGLFDDARRAGKSGILTVFKRRNVKWAVRILLMGATVTGLTIAASSRIRSHSRSTTQPTTHPVIHGNNPGGIDLNSANLDLQIKRDGNGVPLPVSRQDLENIHIDGLIPVILDIKPAMETPLLSQLQASTS